MSTEITERRTFKMILNGKKIDVVIPNIGDVVENEFGGFGTVKAIEEVPLCATVEWDMNTVPKGCWYGAHLCYWNLKIVSAVNALKGE